MKLPIRTRLTLFYCAVFSASTALLEIGVYSGLRASIVAEVDRDLASRLREVKDKLSKHPAGSTLARLQNDLSTHETLHPRFLEVSEMGGEIIFQGPGMRQLPAQAQGRRPPMRTVHTGVDLLRVMVSRWRVRDIDYKIQVATDLAPPLQILQRFGLIVLLSSPAILACASIAGYWISGRALAPVTEIATAARSIGAADLSRRVDVPRNGDELQFLAGTVNGMLSRIEDAFRHISQFTANASHELRTPVALIRSAAEVALLRKPEDIETYREALHRILSEAQRNTILLDDMLSLAKADAGTAVLRMTPVDLGASIQEACEYIGLLAQNKCIHFHVRLCADPLLVTADADHLRRLWLILIENAIKYTPGGQWIEVRLLQGEAGAAICEVADAGIGISEGDLPHVFERFYRADRARDRSGGAGLGLAIAHWIAERHGARIQVESTIGCGSTFRVIFPQTILPQLSSAPALSHTLSRPASSNAALLPPGKCLES